MKNRPGIIVFVCIMMSQLSFAQDDIMKLLENERANEMHEHVMSTFKGTRIIIGHSVETRKKGALEISFMSRYWNTKQETSNSFIADKMSARFGVDYAFTDKFTVGIGASFPREIYDTFFKYRLFQQGIKGEGSPLTVTFLQNANFSNKQFAGIDIGDGFLNKTAYTTQLLIARKFNSNFSLQIAPTFLHRSAAVNTVDDRNHFALGFGGRYKIGNHLSLVSEYYYVANKLKSFETFGAFALGANWEIGSLVLQFKMTNSSFFTEQTFITHSGQNFNFRDNHFFFGFHATYFIQL